MSVVAPTAPVPLRFYRLEGSQLVPTTEDDPRRVIMRDEVVRPFGERVFVAVLIGALSSLVVQSALETRRKRRDR